MDAQQKIKEDEGGIKAGSNALDIAEKRGKNDIVEILQEYEMNPKESAKKWRNELNIKGDLISFSFSFSFFLFSFSFSFFFFFFLVLVNFLSFFKKNLL